MFQRFVNLLQRLWARLSWTGGVHYLNGGPGLPPPLTPEEEKALLARMADGDPAARDELITHNLRLVVYLAKKYEGSGVPSEDMVSIGTIGLIKAVAPFPPESSSKLATSASRSIGKLMGTKDDVVLMTGEGMLALWGALKSCLKPGDHVVSVGTGVFGDGIGEMSESFGCIVE